MKLIIIYTASTPLAPLSSYQTKAWSRAHSVVACIACLSWCKQCKSRLSFSPSVSLRSPQMPHLIYAGVSFSGSETNKCGSRRVVLRRVYSYRQGVLAWHMTHGTEVSCAGDELGERRTEKERTPCARGTVKRSTETGILCFCFLFRDR